MFNSRRNSNINIRFISYPRQATTELPHNNPYITANNNTNNMLHRSESMTSSRQNSSRPSFLKNKITRLVRSINKNLSVSRSPSTRTQMTRMTRTQAASTLSRPPTQISTSARTASLSLLSASVSIIPNLANASSRESEPNSTSSINNDLVNQEQEYSPDSLDSIQPLNTSRSSSRLSRSTPTPPPPIPPPRPPPPAPTGSFNSNINAIREYFNIIPLFHDPRSNNNANSARSSRRRLSNSSHNSINQQPTNTTLDDITAENDFYNSFNHNLHLTQNHSSREAFCFLSKLSSNLNSSNDEDSSSERKSNNNYECEYEQEKQKVDECYLCLESLEFRGGRTIINPGCGHLLHMKCYLEYIKYFKEQCTLCKKDFGDWND